MRILILDTYYRYFTERFYRENPQASKLPYAKQLKKITDQAFGTADFYSKNLKPLGNCVEEVILNNYDLQHQWVKEHGDNRLLDLITKIPYVRKYYKSNWVQEILTDQILDYKPDVIYVQDLTVPGSDFLNNIKKRTHSIVVGQISYNTQFIKDFFSPYDLILTSFPHYLKDFSKLGVTSKYFRIAFESTVLPKLHRNKKLYPVTFVGGFSRYHLKAYETMEWVAKRTPVDFWGYGYNTLSPRSTILKSYHGEAWGIDMYEILHNSKITLNRHSEVSKNYANNMRLYEATGVGSFLITDYKDNLKDLFILGKEIETYKTKEELLEKIKYYSTHEKERAAIAKAGQRRTLKEHTYEERMKELNVLLKDLVKPK